MGTKRDGNVVEVIERILWASNPCENVYTSTGSWVIVKTWFSPTDYRLNVYADRIQMDQPLPTPLFFF